MDNLIPIYKQLLNLENCTFSQIKHDNAIVSVVYMIEQPNKKQFVLKICDRPQDYFREVYFLKYFNGILPVAQIVNVIDPGENIHGAILMEYYSGSLLQETELTDKLAYELGSLLAQIHLNRTVAYGDLTEPHNLNTDHREYFTFKFEEGLAECKNNLPTNMLKQCEQYYDAHIDLLRTVDGPCIIHRDFRPGNIIVNNGKLQGIIDWASARAGFAEDDFCPMELGEWGTNTVNKQSFLNGYASIRPVPNYDDIMPFLRLNRALATIGFTVKRGTWDNSSSDLYKINRNFLEDFLGS